MHIEDNKPSTISKEINWQEKRWSAKEIGAYLKENQPDVLVLRNIPNPRLTVIANMLAFRPTNPEETILAFFTKEDVLQSNIQIDETPIFDALWQLHESLLYEVEIIWSEVEPLTFVDVTFRHRIKGYQKNRKTLSSALPLAQMAQFINHPINYKWQQQELLHIRHHLQDRLPSYMIPSSFMALESIPLTSNGKIDYKALPCPRDRHTHHRLIPPKNEIQKQLLFLWTKLLHIEEISIEDNFLIKEGILC
ncbi:hypothetical protein [Legionella tunisiensis]|uniref:hypothetical protein n=1 Tax=Legionella tunisiensis TaxID=1034944 RepID=UPI0012EA21E3|nr:hypothetical protein [Legionella tunisiensis]